MPNQTSFLNGECAIRSNSSCSYRSIENQKDDREPSQNKLQRQTIFQRLILGAKKSFKWMPQMLFLIFIYLVFRTSHEFNYLLHNERNKDASENFCTTHDGMAYSRKTDYENEFAEIRQERERLTNMISQVQSECQSSVNTFQMSIKGIKDDRNQYMEALRDFIVNEYETLRIQRIGKPDFAQKELGAVIAEHTPTHRFAGRLVSVMGIPFYWDPKSADVILSRATESVVPGDCWPFEGTVGHVKIRLSRPINITSISYEHVSARLLPQDELRNAPKVIHIWAGQTIDTNVNVGEMNFKPLDYGPQTIYIRHGGVPARYVKFDVLDNHGAEHTCIYRIRVHGIPV